MKLTAEQNKAIEDNHKLIYWYANLKGIDIDEWYGILAIELCNTVINYDPTKGSLSNYYKLRADSTWYKEYAKSKSQKRSHNGIAELNDINHPIVPDDIASLISVAHFIKADTTGVLEMKANGYTQLEIAHELEISQATVSRILTKLKGDYYND